MGAAETLAVVRATRTRGRGGGYAAGGFPRRGHPRHAGADATVKVWDVKTQKSVAKMEGHVGAVTSLSFSENGYYMATAARGRARKLWDLRQRRKISSRSKPRAPRGRVRPLGATYLAVVGGS